MSNCNATLLRFEQMSGEYADDDLERQLHHAFTGRDNLLGDFSRLLLHDSTDRFIALIGRSGIGKSAIVTRWVVGCEAAHELVFHHFIHTQQGDKVEPRVIARSLAIQIEKRFPHLRNPSARPEARLRELLAKVSVQELTPHGRRMVLVIDGFDERTSAGDVRDVLACLPRAPSAIRLLLAGRLRDRLRDLGGHFYQVTPIDLDGPCFVADHEATVSDYWRREVAALGLDDEFGRHAVRCAAGSMLHACMLRKHVANVPRSQHPWKAIPTDLPSLLAMLWGRIHEDRAAVRALEILCAAREPLALEQIGRVAGWSDPGDLRAVVSLARELLVETQRRDRVTVYGLFHDAVRAFLVERLGSIAIRGHHRELADRLATWPLPRDAATRRYALRYAVAHRIAAGDIRAIHALASNVDFLEAKSRELGIDDAELDVRRAAEACAAAGQMALHSDLDRLARSLARESQSLHRDAGADTGQLWSRVRLSQRPSDHLEPGSKNGSAQMPGCAGSPPVRPSFPGRPALLGILDTRGGAVTACAVTPDSRRIVAANSDHSISVFDLENRSLLTTITGHCRAVESCAVSPDSRWVVSASADHTLKLWDLETGELLVTFEGHTRAVNSCAVAPGGRYVVSASADHTLKVWDVSTGGLTTTFEGHTGSVESCAVSADGCWVVSASADTTLKLWDLRTGDLMVTLEGHTHPVESCSIAPDGRHVVSGSADHTVKVWHVGSGSVTTTLKGHAGPVTSCAIASDNRSVYSASSDSTVKIWDVDTGRMVTTLEGHSGPVTCCAITPDGRRLISGSSDNTLRVWALGDSRTSTLPGPRVPPPVTPASPANRSIVPRARKARRAKPLILFLAAKGTTGAFTGRNTRRSSASFRSPPTAATSKSAPSGRSPSTIWRDICSSSTPPSSISAVAEWMPRTPNPAQLAMRFRRMTRGSGCTTSEAGCGLSPVVRSR